MVVRGRVGERQLAPQPPSVPAPFGVLPPALASVASLRCASVRHDTCGTTRLIPLLSSGTLAQGVGAVSPQTAVSRSGKDLRTGDAPDGP